MISHASVTIDAVAARERFMHNMAVYNKHGSADSYLHPPKKDIKIKLTDVSGGDSEFAKHMAELYKLCERAKEEGEG